ncbi:multicomponent K+:H+ antiporter subunit G [Angulomicrobium tetraedrale]|uniref:Multicomponent K+:H+ antiporter subunit G n=1 Tax=Ancylobacter tetraedralis TaxID=217068 RepID=A0A839ZB35_9HYPH|nr:monovalent cation/H(+) antiporter subunit G [Ancylobacter tetraedralis]MBB3771937.1 multicomponent K+:H+ antiporter subunit G [Ancylobacter tetraedralis]
MNEAPDLPLWAAVLVSLLVVAGAAITLIGSVGLVRLPDFYSRLHAPSLGATLGTGCILIGSMLCFGVLRDRLLIHEALIALFITITTPVTMMLLARASLYRDRVEGNRAAPEHDPEPTEP